MGKKIEKTIGFRAPEHDPEWLEGRTALARKAIDMRVTPRKLSRELELLVASGDPMALMVLKRLKQYGVTDALVNEIDHFVHNVCVFAVPEIDPKTRKFKWRHGGDVKPSGWSDTPPIFSADYEIFCFALMRLIDAGITEVERCKAPAPLDHPYQKSKGECGHYFFSKRNRKWCSTTCQVRVSSRKAKGAE